MPSCHFGSRALPAFKWGAIQRYKFLSFFLCTMAPTKTAIELSIEKALTEEVAKSLDNWAKVLEWAKLDQDTWKKIAGELGAEDVEDNMTIANVADEDYLDAVNKLQLKGIAKARINVAINVARHQVGVPITDIFARTAITVPSPSTPKTALAEAELMGQPGVIKNGLNANTIWDQGCKIVVQPLGKDDIRLMRMRWTDIHELEPTEEVNPTDNQLSMFARLNTLGHNILAFDMGVWGPYGGRRERAFTMMAAVKTVDGTYLPKEVPGPRNVEDWTTAWEFATATFIMGGAMSEGVATAYRKHVTRVASNFPQHWHIVANADWKLRHEWALTELRRQEDFYASNPMLSKFNPKQPWSAILLSAVKGLECMEFWKLNVDDRVQKMEREGVHLNTWIDRQAESGLPAGQGSAASSMSTLATYNPGNPPGSGKRALKRKAAELRRATGQPAQAQPPAAKAARTEEAQRSEWADTKRADGRWIYDVGGTELCFGYGRYENGCGETCQSTPRRAHGCEWCRGPHRTIHCNVVKNWKPPPAKGAGKGKGKKHQW